MDAARLAMLAVLLIGGCLGASTAPEEAPPDEDGETVWTGDEATAKATAIIADRRDLTFNVVRFETNGSNRAGLPGWIWAIQLSRSAPTHSLPRDPGDTTAIVLDANGSTRIDDGRIAVQGDELRIPWNGTNVTLRDVSYPEDLGRSFAIDHPDRSSWTLGSYGSALDRVLEASITSARVVGRGRVYQIRGDLHDGYVERYDLTLGASDAALARLVQNVSLTYTGRTPRSVTDERIRGSSVQLSFEAYYEDRTADEPIGIGKPRLRIAFRLDDTDVSLTHRYRDPDTVD